MVVSEVQRRGLRGVRSARVLSALSLRIANLPVFVALSVSVFSIGCGGGQTGPVRMPISGTVTREGIPIDEGLISFVPTSGPAVNGAILAGKYKFSSGDGVPVGKYAVTIAASPKRDPSFVGKKSDAPILKDDRFKEKVPAGGWKREVEITNDKKATYDFQVP